MYGYPVYLLPILLQHHSRYGAHLRMRHRHVRVILQVRYCASLEVIACGACFMIDYFMSNSQNDTHQ